MSSRLFTSKLALPGAEWSLEDSRRARVYANLVVAWHASGSRHALVYDWRLRDAGLWREALRSLLALESGSFQRQRERVAVRLVTRLGNDGPAVRLVTRLGNDGPAAREQGKRPLDDFVEASREDLARL